jgi:hypothetical protein
LFRPLEDTIRDTHAWDAPRTSAERTGKGHKLIGASLSPERERELLDAWHAASAANPSS